VKYLVIHHMDEGMGVDDAPDEELDAWVSEMEATGVKQLGAELRPSREAALVRVRGGEVLVTDGPFAETKEQIAGFDILECASLDEAVKHLSRHPGARIGALEVRALRAP
jgi:hypothetical protein